MVTTLKVSPLAGAFFQVKHKELVQFIGPQERAKEFALGKFQPTMRTVCEDAPKDAPVFEEQDDPDVVDE